MRGKVTAYDNTELDMGGTTKATTFGNTKVTIGGDCDGSMLQAFGDTTVYAQYITDHEQVSEIHLFDSAKADVCETGDSQIHLHSLDAAMSGVMIRSTPCVEFTASSTALPLPYEVRCPFHSPRAGSHTSKRYSLSLLFNTPR